VEQVYTDNYYHWHQQFSCTDGKFNGKTLNFKQLSSQCNRYLYYINTLQVDDCATGVYKLIVVAYCIHTALFSADDG